MNRLAVVYVLAIAALVVLAACGGNAFSNAAAVDAGGDAFSQGEATDDAGGGIVDARSEFALLDAPAPHEGGDEQAPPKDAGVDAHDAGSMSEAGPHDAGVDAAPWVPLCCDNNGSYPPDSGWYCSGTCVVGATCLLPSPPYPAGLGGIVISGPSPQCP